MIFKHQGLGGLLHVLKQLSGPTVLTSLFWDILNNLHKRLNKGKSVATRDLLEAAPQIYLWLLLRIGGLLRTQADYSRFLSRTETKGAARLDNQTT